MPRTVTADMIAGSPYKPMPIMPVTKEPHRPRIVCGLPSADVRHTRAWKSRSALPKAAISRSAHHHARRGVGIADRADAATICLRLASKRQTTDLRMLRDEGLTRRQDADRAA